MTEFTRASPSARPALRANEALETELARRLRQPQRHRLLHGYPMAPLMARVAGERPPYPAVEADPARPLIVGILPHASCNPKVRGCGFCTFPHDHFDKDLVRRVVQQVGRELAHAAPQLRGRWVEAVYLGGGTANLTPAGELSRLVAQLGELVDLAHSELTLEGVPRYFLIRDEAALDVVSRAPVGRRRISMGVQTFDPETLVRMGRDAFGDRDEIARVVERAHARGFTASADLLFNLPGRTAEHALADVREAIAIGFDQVCIYNLVLSPDIDSEWARSESLLAALPPREDRLATWRALRDLLLERDYVQTTLTNFERRTSRRFAYEVASFDPATYDAVGFGPAAISTLTSRDRRAAIKWINAGTGEGYARAMHADAPVDRTFHYAPGDLRLLHVTRNLSALAIDRARYAGFFGADVVDDFARELDAAHAAGLVAIDDARVALTPDGMFHADAVAGLLAHGRVAELRGTVDDRASRRSHM